MLSWPYGQRKTGQRGWEAAGPLTPLEEGGALTGQIELSLIPAKENRTECAATGGLSDWAIGPA